MRRKSESTAFSEALGIRRKTMVSILGMGDEDGVGVEVGVRVGVAVGVVEGELRKLGSDTENW